MTTHRKFMDFSAGDPALPLREIARHAFEMSMKDLNIYQFNNPATLPDGEVMRRALWPVSDYFTARKLHDKGCSSLGFGSILMTGGGTTEGFDLIVRRLVEDVRQENERREILAKRNPPAAEQQASCTGREDDVMERLSRSVEARRAALYGKPPKLIKPAVITPVPTYGYFLDILRRANVRPILVPRDLDNGGRLDLAKVNEAVEKARAEGYRIVAYYDSNPHNPLGLIRGHAETEKLAALMEYHSREQQKQDEEDGYFRGNDAELARIRLIDDIVYDGLAYKGSEKPVSFAQVEGEFRNSFILAGISKVGLASLRGGLVIGKSTDIFELRQIQRLVSYFPPAPAMHALSAYFNDAAPFAGWREVHLKKLNAAHEFSGKLMKVLINGLDEAEPINERELSRMVSLLKSREGLTPPEAYARLYRGIRNVKVITSPRAGFFHLLDFSACRGVPWKLSGWDKGPANDEGAIVPSLEKQNLKLASGTFTGLKAEQMIMRATFAVKSQDVLEFVNRLEAAVSHRNSPAPVTTPEPSSL